MRENYKENALIFKKKKSKLRKTFGKVLNYENVFFKNGTFWAWEMMSWWIKDLAYKCEGWTWSLWHRILGKRSGSLKFQHLGGRQRSLQAG